MHHMNDLDPLIVSLTGSVTLSAPIVSAIESGELEPEGAFARFSGTCHALAPQCFDSNQLQAHEAFWCFDDGAQIDQTISGELAWFQTGVYTSSVALQSVPLLVHAAGEAVQQLGTSSFDSIRVQVPHARGGFSEKAIQQLVDQFSALANVRSAVEVHAHLMCRRHHKRWTSEATTWFDNTYLVPLALQNLEMAQDRVNLDNRWALRQAQSLCTAVFSAPEWSLSLASTIAVLMVEATRATCTNGTLIVEVKRG